MSWRVAKSPKMAMSEHPIAVAMFPSIPETPRLALRLLSGCTGKKKVSASRIGMLFARNRDQEEGRWVWRKWKRPGSERAWCLEKKMSIFFATLWLRVSHAFSQFVSFDAGRSCAIAEQKSSVEHIMRCVRRCKGSKWWG